MQDHSAPQPRSVRHVVVTAEDEGQRLDNWLLRVAKGVPKSHIYKVVRSGQVRVNGGRVKVSRRLLSGDTVRVPPMHMRTSSAVRVPDKLQQALRAAIVMETDDFIVINKPAGIAVHGGSGLAFGAIDGLRQALQSPKLELAHRLDRGTSGALLVARDRKRCRMLQELFRTGLVGKRYVALASGAWPQNTSTVSEPLLANAEKAGERRVVVDHAAGKPSVTHFKVLRSFAVATELAVTLETGRTHQIRVHAAHTGNPLVGDERYGNKRDNQRFRQLGLRRLYLHAAQLEFQWNDSVVVCDVPPDTAWMNALKPLQQQL